MECIAVISMNAQKLCAITDCIAVITMIAKSCGLLWNALL